MAADIFLECDLPLEYARCVLLYLHSRYPAAEYSPISLFLASAQTPSNQKIAQKIATYILPSSSDTTVASKKGSTSTSALLDMKRRQYGVVDFVVKHARPEMSNTKALFTPSQIAVLLRVYVTYPGFHKAKAILLLEAALREFERLQDPAGLLRCLEFATEMKWEPLQQQQQRNQNSGAESTDKNEDMSGVKTRAYLERKIRLYEQVLLHAGQSFRMTDKDILWSTLGLRPELVEDVGLCVFFSKTNRLILGLMKKHSAVLQQEQQQQPKQQQHKQGKHAKPTPSSPLALRGKEYYVTQEFAWQVVIPEIVQRAFKSVDAFLKGGSADETFANEWDMQITATLNLAAIVEKYKALLCTPQQQAQQSQQDGRRKGGTAQASVDTEEMALLKVLDRFRGKIVASLCMSLFWRSARQDQTSALLIKAASEVSSANVLKLCDQIWKSALMQPLIIGEQFATDPNTAFSSILLFLYYQQRNRAELCCKKMEEKIQRTIPLER